MLALIQDTQFANYVAGQCTGCTDKTPSLSTCCTQEKLCFCTTTIASPLQEANSGFKSQVRDWSVFKQMWYLETVKRGQRFGFYSCVVQNSAFALHKNSPDGIQGNHGENKISPFSIEIWQLLSSFLQVGQIRGNCSNLCPLVSPSFSCCVLFLVLPIKLDCCVFFIGIDRTVDLTGGCSNSEGIPSSRLVIHLILILKFSNFPHCFLNQNSCDGLRIATNV